MRGNGVAQLRVGCFCSAIEETRQSTRAYGWEFVRLTGAQKKLPLQYVMRVVKGQRGEGAASALRAALDVILSSDLGALARKDDLQINRPTRAEEEVNRGGGFWLDILANRTWNNVCPDSITYVLSPCHKLIRHLVKADCLPESKRKLGTGLLMCYRDAVSDDRLTYLSRARDRTTS